MNFRGVIARHTSGLYKLTKNSPDQKGRYYFLHKINLIIVFLNLNETLVGDHILFTSICRIDLGVKQLPPESLLFFCDADVTITPDFLTRCRHNAIQGKQVKNHETRLALAQERFSLNWFWRYFRNLKLLF